MKNYNIVVSVNNNDVIGYNNQLLIESKEDLKRLHYPKMNFPMLLLWDIKHG